MRPFLFAVSLKLYAKFRENPKEPVTLPGGGSISGGDLVALMLYEQLGRR